MIDSVYEALGAYKRQGRINVPAAMNAIHIPDQSEAIRTALTPELEYTIDALALCNGRIGKYLGNRKSVTWKELRMMFWTCEVDCADYWEHKGWRVPEVEDIYDTLREYVVQCVRSLDAKSRKGLSPDWRIQTIGRSLGYDDRRIKWATDVAPWIFLPQFIAGFTDDDIVHIYKMQHSMQDGLSVVQGNYEHIYCQSEWDYQGIQFSVNYIQGGKERCFHAGSWLEIDEEYPKLRQWYLDPANPKSLDPDGDDRGTVYAIATNSAVYFYGYEGKAINFSRISNMMLAYNWIATGSYENKRVPRFYSGIKFNGDDTVTAIDDITDTVYHRLGYNGEGYDRFCELMAPYEDLVE